jgi:hypothetical protein
MGWCSAVSMTGSRCSREKIVADPARSSARLDEMAGAYGDPAAPKRAYLQNADAMREAQSLALMLNTCMPQFA